MSVHAGQILHIGGLNLLDRIQSAGLGTVKVPVDTVREVGNPLVVDKVPTEPEFTFSLQSYDVTAELEAFLTGKVGTAITGGAGPGASDPDGTEYKWSKGQFVNILSPWKASLASGGSIAAGHLIPSFFPTKLSYRFGVKQAAEQTVDLVGGAFYYAEGTPIEDFHTGNGSTTAYPTVEPAIPYRIGGSGGSSFTAALGVIVDGVQAVYGVDYTDDAVDASTGTRTITFTTAPRSGADIRIAYFSATPHAYPDTDHADLSVKPAEVRGRHICVYLGSGGSRQRLGAVQTVQVDASTEYQLERELCNTESVGITINGYDCTGNLVARSKDRAQFFQVLSKVTGVDVANEVVGWLNVNAVPMTVQILNPKNPGQVLKTIYIPDAIFSIPGTPAKVNTPTDFQFDFESQNGDFSVFKGSYLP